MTLDFSDIKSAQALQRKTDAHWKNTIFNFIKFYDGPESYLLQKTSGSTGTPKEITLSKQVLNASAKATIDFFKLKKQSSALLCIPAEYVGGKMMLVRAALGQWQLDCIEPKLYLKISEKTYEFAAMIPAQVQNLLDEDLPALQRIKNLIIGGAPVSLELETELNRLNINAFSTYGMTETASHVALRKLDLESNFKAMDGVSFNTDSENCLVISGDRIPNLTLKTNDVVELISEKEFIWKGRKDNVINSGGLKIMVEELEKSLTKLIKTPFYIKSGKHPQFGESPVLVLERHEISEEEKQALILKLRSELAKNHVPTEIICKATFEYTKSGKIVRN